MAKQTVTTVRTTRTRTRASSPGSTVTKSSSAGKTGIGSSKRGNTSRCPSCGRYK